MKDYLKHISKLEKDFKINFNHDLKNLVNYKNYRSLPFQNWCNYQEGFSQEIFDWFIKYNKIKINSGLFLDPFCGSGSSLIAAKNSGLDVIGIDINPFSALLTKTKVQKYSKKEISIIRNFQVPEYKVIPNVYKNYEFSMIERLFSKRNFIKIELLKMSINKVQNTKAREFLYTALVCCLESSSNYRKAGNGLKKRKKSNRVDFFKEYEEKLNQMLEDIYFQGNTSKHQVIFGNVNEIEKLVKKNSVNLSVFSPPYPNCFDYFEVYKIELWVGEFVKTYKELRTLRKSAMTSNLNANLTSKVELSDAKKISRLLFLTLEIIKKKELWNKNIPTMLILYFYEMNIFMRKLSKLLKKGGSIGIVIGNSSYAGVPILSDLILSEIASQNNLSVEEIVVARKNETASQQYKKISSLIKYVRESIIIISK